MAKWGLIILGAIIGIALGSILVNQVCEVSKQELGSGNIFMRATCTILSAPIDWIILIIILIALIILVIKYYH